MRLSVFSINSKIRSDAGEVRLRGGRCGGWGGKLEVEQRGTRKRREMSEKIQRWSDDGGWCGSGKGGGWRYVIPGGKPL